MKCTLVHLSAKISRVDNQLQTSPLTTLPYLRCPVLAPGGHLLAPADVAEVCGEVTSWLHVKRQLHAQIISAHQLGDDETVLEVAIDELEADLRGRLEVAVAVEANGIETVVPANPPASFWHMTLHAALAKALLRLPVSAERDVIFVLLTARWTAPATGPTSLRPASRNESFETRTN